MKKRERCSLSRLLGLGMLVLAVAFGFSSSAYALTCTDIGGTDVGGDCTLDAWYFCTDDTTVTIPGDFTITGDGAIICGDDADADGDNLTIDVGGDMTIDVDADSRGTLSSNGDSGTAGSSGNPGANGQPGFDGGIITVTVGGSMTVDGTIEAAGGAGGAGGAGQGASADGGNGALGGSGGQVLIEAGGSYLLSATGIIIAEAGAGGSGGPGGTGGDGGNGATAGAGGIVDIYSCETTINYLVTANGATGGSGGSGGSAGDGGDNGSGGAGGDITLSSGRDLTLASTALLVAEGGAEGVVGAGGTGGSAGSDVGVGGAGGVITKNHCADYALADSGATISVVGGPTGGAGGTITDLANAPCCPCQVQITKTVARDDDCDGVADEAFGESVIQDEGECVVYKICVENTATNGSDIPQDLLDILVDDTHLAITAADFGDLDAGDAQYCLLVPSEISAGNCDGGECVCEDVEGLNTAVIDSATCAATGGDACLEPGSDCDDTATVACAGCSVSIDKTVALDNNCDGTADGAFLETVTQEDGECVIYKICVSNTGDQVLDGSGVTVNDGDINVTLDFGDIAIADTECLEVPTTENPAGACETGDPADCECEEVEGVNTANITAAVCSDTGKLACDDAASDCSDDAEVICVDCSVDIEKTVALDDDCDGVADGPFSDYVLQVEDECVVYKICVENTGGVDLNTSGVEVDDDILGIVALNFGTLTPAQVACLEIPSQGSASDCTGGSCVCQVVEGVNEAVVSAAICDGIGTNACDYAASDCDDTAEVECLACSVEIDKTVALDDDCDGIADGLFEDSVTQEPDECVIYKICVSNTGEQELDASGVTVNDADIQVTLDFGPIAALATECLEVPTTENRAGACTADPESCVCEEVEGENTASISAAVCEDTGENACDFLASDCEDTADVDCLGEGCFTRTPGYWGTHPDVTALFLPVSSCGYNVDELPEAIQDMCWGGKDKAWNQTSGQQLQLIRQCTAARLNLEATAFFDGDCEATVDINGSLLERIEYCCEDLCTSGARKQDISRSGCIEDLDAFNNYWDEFDPIDNIELCPNQLLGTEPPCDANSELCEDANGDGVINPR